MLYDGVDCGMEPVGFGVCADIGCVAVAVFDDGFGPSSHVGQSLGSATVVTPFNIKEHPRVRVFYVAVWSNYTATPSESTQAVPFHFIVFPPAASVSSM